VFLEVKTPQLKLCVRQLRLGHIHRAGNSGSIALPLDFDQLLPKTVLLVQGFELVPVRVKLDIREGCLRDDFLAGVTQRGLRRLERSAGGTNHVRLRKREQQGIRCDVIDRRLADRKAIGVTEARSDAHCRYVGVFCLAQARSGTIHIGGGHLDLMGIAQRQVNRGVEGDLRLCRLCSGDRQGGDGAKHGSSDSRTRRHVWQRQCPVRQRPVLVATCLVG
jgi:hypothetical protein